MNVEETFRQLGGQFLTPAKEIIRKIQNTEAILLDWDGVFNNGEKGYEHYSTYSEIDSMGLNMLRFAIWQQQGKLPFAGILTGQVNQSAFELAKREHFNAVYFNFKAKQEALEHLKKTFHINPSKVLYFFDDILDIPAASMSGFAILIRRTSSPLFTDYVIKHEIADYITAHTAEQNAIREACELLLGLMNVYNSCVQQRIDFSESYQQYLAERNKVNSMFYHKAENKILQTKI